MGNGERREGGFTLPMVCDIAAGAVLCFFFIAPISGGGERRLWLVLWGESGRFCSVDWWGSSCLEGLIENGREKQLIQFRIEAFMVNGIACRLIDYLIETRWGHASSHICDVKPQFRVVSTLEEHLSPLILFYSFSKRTIFLPSSVYLNSQPRGITREFDSIITLAPFAGGLIY